MKIDDELALSFLSLTLVGREGTGPDREDG
jgi:hypothetical protein